MVSVWPEPPSAIPAGQSAGRTDVITRRRPERCDKPRFFVHVRDVETAGMKMLVEGQLVAYEVGRTRDGRSKAVNLRLL